MKCPKCDMVVHADAKVKRLMGEDMPCPRDSCDHRFLLQEPDSALLYFLKNGNG